MTTLSRETRAVKATRGTKVHTQGTPAAGPVHAFALLVGAMHDRDRPRADEARRELRRWGYAVTPIGTPPRPKGGAR